MYLFIDTSVKIVIGVLNSDYEWMNYKEIDSKKSSSILHHEVLEMLEGLELTIQKLEGIIQIAGPGSYTGMRVSEGFKQVFDWQGFSTYSFYHFDVPRILGISSGSWISKAFKGEIFVHSWNEDNQNQSLIKEIDYKADREDQYSSNLDFKNTQSTSEMIFNEPKKIFSYIIKNNIQNKIYYYRTLEAEFGQGSRQ